jgi:hypothetical protein
MDSERLPAAGTWRRPALLAGVLLAALVAAAAVMWWNAARQDRRREAVATEVLAGRLRPDAAGVVTLPAEFAAASVDGRVYVTRMPDGLTFVLFPSWRGKGSNLRGHLYTSAYCCFEAQSPAEEGGLPTVELIGPAVPPAGTAAKIEVSVERRLDRHWLRVSRSKD